MKTRYIMIGGFLGAGKTTTVGRLAEHYMSQGLRVGIVTNDQTTDLVDTHNLRARGYEVGEVAGSCFCCNFNELTATVERLGAGQPPDVILAEPVGSCTDLVATVIRPLMQIYERPLEIAPYGVILKPSHGEKILRRDGRGGFSPQAEYIFRKQLEEADFIIINRVDELPNEQVEALSRLLAEEYPDRPIVRVSAKTGAGFAELTEMLERHGAYGQRVMDVDYDIYAQGEADLGWLNSQCSITAERDFDIDQFLLDLLRRLQANFCETGAETAHLKAIGMSDGVYAVANLVSNNLSVELSLASGARLRSANVVVNARVATAPEELESLVRDAVRLSAEQIQADHEVETLQSFRPGRPVPTHRLNPAGT